MKEGLNFHYLYSGAAEEITICIFIELYEKYKVFLIVAHFDDGLFGHNEVPASRTDRYAVQL